MADTRPELRPNPDDVPTAPPDTARMPYQRPFPPEAKEEIVINGAVPGAEDERLWVPLGEDIHFRPLFFGTVTGDWANLLRVRKSGILSRHRHILPVHAWVVKGRWEYLEHGWTAEEGTYVFEAPGETHTLVVPEDVSEMITFFHTQSAIVYVDPYGRATGYEDVFTRIELARKHYKTVGLGSDYVDQFIR